MEIQNAWYRISIKALVYNENGDFMLIKEHSGVWDFPGGGFDHFENPIDCLIRELKEEMGLEIEYINKNPKYFITSHKPESKSRPFIANVFYEVKLKNLDFKKSDECQEIGFFNINNINSIKTLVNVGDFVKAIKAQE